MAIEEWFHESAADVGHISLKNLLGVSPLLIRGQMPDAEDDAPAFVKSRLADRWPDLEEIQLSQTQNDWQSAERTLEAVHHLRDGFLVLDEWTSFRYGTRTYLVFKRVEDAVHFRLAMI